MSCSEMSDNQSLGDTTSPPTGKALTADDLFSCCTLDLTGPSLEKAGKSLGALVPPVPKAPPLLKPPDFPKPSMPVGSTNAHAEVSGHISLAGGQVHHGLSARLLAPGPSASPESAEQVSSASCTQCGQYTVHAQMMFIALALIFVLDWLCSTGWVFEAMKPYVALAFSFVSLVAQCFVAAGPLAIGLAAAVLEFPDVLTSAFQKMQGNLHQNIHSLIQQSLPKVHEHILGALVKPFVEIFSKAIDQVKVFVKVENDSMPNAIKDARRFKFLVGIGLLIFLGVAQVPSFLLAFQGGCGMMVGIVTVVVHALLITISLNAKRIVRLAWVVVELVVNKGFKGMIFKVIDKEALDDKIQHAMRMKSGVDVPGTMSDDSSHYCVVV